MVLRIAVGAFAALRAVLIYGEAAQLATQHIDVPQLRALDGARRRRTVLSGQLLS